MSFFFHRRPSGDAIRYDPQKQQPAVRRSICTGEMTGGLADLDSGAFHELELLRDAREVEDFCRRCGVSKEDLRTIY